MIHAGSSSRTRNGKPIKAETKGSAYRRTAKEREKRAPRAHTNAHHGAPGGLYDLTPRRHRLIIRAFRLVRVPTDCLAADLRFRLPARGLRRATVPAADTRVPMRRDRWTATRPLFGGPSATTTDSRSRGTHARTPADHLPRSRSRFRESRSPATKSITGAARIGVY